jgi:hypothetical protein
LKKMPDVQRVRIDVIGIARDAAGNTVRVDWIKGAISED